MKRSLTIVCFFCFFISFSQQQKEIDSLVQLVKTTTVDTLKVKSLLKLEYAYRFSEYKKGLAYAEKALSISKNINWQKGLVLCYNNMGNSFLDRSEHSEALAYYKKSLLHSQKNLKLRIMTFMNISNIYLREKNFKLSQHYINKAYEIATELSDQEEIAYCYYQMGLIYRDQNNNAKAEEYLEKSLHIFRTKYNQFQIAEVTNFLGEVTTDYTLKLTYLLESKSIWDAVAPDYLSAVNNSLLLAKTYITLSKDAELKKTTRIKKSNSELINEAEILAFHALKCSKLSNTKQYIMDSYGVLSEVKALKNEFSAAYEYSILHKNLNDSIFSQESKNKIATLESQNEIELRDKQLQINSITLKAKEKQKWFYIFGIGLLIIIAGLLFYQSSNRKKNNQKLQRFNVILDQANKTKIRLLGILNHDLRSPVNSFIHFMQFQKENPNVLDYDTKSRIENDTLSSAKTLLHSMEDILLWTKDQMENFHPILKNTSADLIFSEITNHFSNEKRITIIVENAEKISVYTDENYLNTIIRNLTANSIKALEETENPTIIWKAWQENGKTFLSITDNGKGATSEVFKTLYDDQHIVGVNTGLGLHLIRDLAQAIGCEIKVHTELNKGTTVILQI